MLLAKAENKTTAWYWAVQKGTLELLTKIWELVEENLTTEELKNDFLIATIINGYTAWHLSVFSGKIKVLQKIWEWAK